MVSFLPASTLARTPPSGTALGQLGDIHSKGTPELASSSHPGFPGAILLPAPRFPPPPGAASLHPLPCTVPGLPRLLRSPEEGGKLPCKGKGAHHIPSLQPHLACRWRKLCFQYFLKHQPTTPSRTASSREQSIDGAPAVSPAQ